MDNLLRKIDDFFRKLFKGRNGGDALSLFLLVFSSIASLIAVLRKSVYLNYLSNFIFIYVIFRMFSKNIYKRSLENQKFLAKVTELKKELDLLKLKIKNRKEYKYFKCQNCKTNIRIPRGKGRINIKCPRCGNKFEGRS